MTNLDTSNTTSLGSICDGGNMQATYAEQQLNPLSFEAFGYRLCTSQRFPPSCYCMRSSLRATNGSAAISPCLPAPMPQAKDCGIAPKVPPTRPLPRGGGRVGEGVQGLRTFMPMGVPQAHGGLLGHLRFAHGHESREAQPNPPTLLFKRGK